MAWKDSLKQGKEIVLATCSDNAPHAIIVISQGFVDEKLLINACEMQTTLKNIKNNNMVCIVTKHKKEYYRLKGTAKIYSAGKYFETSLKRNQGPPVQYSIVVEIKEVFDLDRLKRIL